MCTSAQYVAVQRGGDSQTVRTYLTKKKMRLDRQDHGDVINASITILLFLLRGKEEVRRLGVLMKRGFTGLELNLN